MLQYRSHNTFTCLKTTRGHLQFEVGPLPSASGGHLVGVLVGDSEENQTIIDTGHSCLRGGPQQKHILCVCVSMCVCVCARNQPDKGF